jgi:hypothetical protein
MNIFKQLILSIYSPKSIASWRFQGIGKTILFVFFLTLISILPTAIQLSNGIVDGLNLAQETIEEDIPDFTIKNGELISNTNSAVQFQEKDFTIIFDPTGDIDLSDLDLSLDSIALLKNEFAITTAGTVEHFSYSMMDLNLSKEDAVQFINSMDTLLTVIIPILIIVIYLFSSAMKFIGISVLALIGTLLSKSGDDSLKYRHLWRMAAYSVTLPTVFFMIMDIFQTPVPFGFVLNWFVSILVLVLALKEIPKAEQ